MKLPRVICDGLNLHRWKFGNDIMSSLNPFIGRCERCGMTAYELFGIVDSKRKKAMERKNTTVSSTPWKP